MNKLLQFCLLIYFSAIGLTTGCSLKSLTKARKVDLKDRKYLVEESCSQKESPDTFCLVAVGSSDLKTKLTEGKRKLNMVYFVNSYCHGFYKNFLGNRNAFDSIEDLSIHVIFEEDFCGIPTLKSRLLSLKYYGQHYILDENEFGRYRDPRTKNLKVLEFLTPENTEIMISPFEKIPENGPYTPGYAFLTATLYLLFDENLNFLSASWELSPNDVKRILNGEKPLQ